MSLELPAAISRYFAADQGRDADALSLCFTDDAIVKNDGRLYDGIGAIREWKVETSRKYRYTSTPVALGIDDDWSVVTSHLRGDFPGSPVDLRYFFRLDGDRVLDLEIIV